MYSTVGKLWPTLGLDNTIIIIIAVIIITIIITI